MLNNHWRIIGCMSNLPGLQWRCTEDRSKGEELRHTPRHAEMFAAAKGTLLVEPSQPKEKPQHLLRLFLMTESPWRLSEGWAYSGLKRRNCEFISLSSGWKCRKKNWNREVAPWCVRGSAGFALTELCYTSSSGGEVPCYLLFQSHQVSWRSLERTQILTQQVL